MKKLKLKKKNTFIAIIILLFIILELVNPSRIIALNKLNKHGYSKESSVEIIKKGLKNDVLSNEYSKFIDLNVFDESFIKDNYAFYKGIDYNKQIDVSVVNKLKDKGYDEKETSLIINHGDSTSINNLLSKDKYPNIKDYLSFSYAKLSLLDRYIDYYKKNSISYEEVTTMVNIGLDQEFYTNTKEVKDFSITMLVNKYNALSSSFVPKNLVSFDSEYCKGTCPTAYSEVVKAFKEMAMALKEEKNLTIYANSAYRSYAYQEETYDSLTKKYGPNYNVAKPGYSEHQTGLSVDIGSGSNKTFKGSQEEKWLNENSYKFGFIKRYDSKKVDITGYDEPWHYRYVGKDIASDIYKKKITFDEYYVKFLER